MCKPSDSLTSHPLKQASTIENIVYVDTCSVNGSEYATTAIDNNDTIYPTLH